MVRLVTVEEETGGGVAMRSSSGTTAAIGAGEQPFFVTTIGPDSTASGKVVYDVPPSVLAKKPEIRINELGFGPTHGYIRLPNL